MGRLAFESENILSEGPRSPRVQPESGDKSRVPFWGKITCQFPRSRAILGVGRSHGIPRSRARSQGHVRGGRT